MRPLLCLCSPNAFCVAALCITPHRTVKNTKISEKIKYVKMTMGGNPSSLSAVAKLAHVERVVLRRWITSYDNHWRHKNQLWRRTHTRTPGGGRHIINEALEILVLKWFSIMRLILQYAVTSAMLKWKARQVRNELQDPAMDGFLASDNWVMRIVMLCCLVGVDRRF